MQTSALYKPTNTEYHEQVLLIVILLNT